uniref:Uncharacterized protein n=1 Tax=Anguilla anguilla TaxID=7936 RepID=A0A0E9RHA0_ANGAN
MYMMTFGFIFVGVGILPRAQFKGIVQFLISSRF